MGLKSVMEAPEVPKTNRPQNRRKVKTGCLTCKKRRVKCDEARPSCERCLSTGRVCDGYGIWDSVSKAPIQEISGKPCSIGFEYFRKYTVNKLPGVFESGFWNSLVFQACVEDPAVLHAATALGAAHKNEEAISLVEYNQAIQHLRRHLNRLDNDALRVSLITCMIFACLELLRGGFKTGHAHLTNGMQLLREIQTRQGITSLDGPIVLRTHPQSVEDALVEVFSRLNIQAMLFGQVSNHHIFVSERAPDGPKYNIPSSFQNHTEARKHLDSLINGVYNLTQQGRNILHNQKQVSEHQRGLLADLTPRKMYRTPLLRLYHTMATIMAATSLRGTDEMIFDSYNSNFEALLRQATELWDVMHNAYLAFKKLTGYVMPAICFTADMGFIPPLYFTVIKCRQPNLRRMAIEILMSAPHREGAWSGPLVARMAEHIMAREEEGIYEDLDIMPTCQPGSALPVVPHSSRFNDIKVSLPERVGGKAVLFCSRYLGGGEWIADNQEFAVSLEDSVSSRIWDSDATAYFARLWNGQI
ncbi:fungal zn(2)-Cys(6) binuclear cluster domain-containing protein [Trichoderma breve]|uniref:Fungal zn(2)-Cys(6) binuclear cluster domain-containing protein n=1 Tax=Trichoderma breve TaxID=2034170 RepID=A0A9W9BDC6_9HYPO|nr:fungal zn(2)-Cys(6) binuclear cluster domain-containing protein [Trichoderma breve]KAJ4858285.1 fungal zn(2)-Cys(6) binuclear cluster domain-containing protein [Trichoderma breve]